MSYTKPDQAAFTQLNPGEFVVNLDSGESVAVHAESSIEAISGNPVVHAWTRVVNPDGSDKLDGQGQPMHSAFSHCSNMTEVTNVGGIPVIQKCAMMAILGEPTTPLWTDPIHASTLESASIRTNILSSFHAGKVDVSTLI